MKARLGLHVGYELALASLCALMFGGCDAANGQRSPGDGNDAAGGTVGSAGGTGDPTPGVGASGATSANGGSASGAGESGGAGGASGGAGGASGGAGGASGGAGGAPSSCTGGPASPIIQRTFSPQRFNDGADPSGEPECTEVLNPERGIFQFRDLRSIGSLTGLRSQGYSLIYGKILIDDYLSRDIDDALLDALDGAFDAARSAGIKVLPRVYYADDGSSPDAPLDRVLSHIEQLGPVWRDNADVIAAVHAGFVGAWGEWHTSTNDLTEPANRKQIFDALLAEVPDDRVVLARRPSHKQAAYGGPLDAQTAFTGTPLARIGHLNDCFLASATDMGTYQLEGEKEYASSDSAFTAVGGETCAVNPPRSECASALSELALHHWSFVNTSYHPDVIAGWKSEGCFDRIRCRLGYRFLLLSHESPQAARAGDRFELKLRVFNDGFARAYNPRPLYLVFRGPTEYVAPTSVDIRSLAPGEATEHCLAAELPADLPAGSYQVALWMPDPAASLRADARFALRLSNGVTWDPSSGLNVLDADLAIAP